MSNQYFWQVVIPLAIGTISIRYSFIFLEGKFRVPKFTRELFTFIPAAVLPALFMPMVYFHKGSSAFFEGRERFVSFMIALLLSLFVRNILFTILVGILFSYFLKLVF